MIDQHQMIEVQLKSRGIRDERVLAAFARVARENFVRPQDRARAYEDQPLGIGHGVTISQPYIVAKTLEAAKLKAGDRVLEIGTGSGYQTSLLAAMGCEVYSIEIIPELHLRAKELLREHASVRLHLGDGHKGWPEDLRFDAILLSAAPANLPLRLLRQLKLGGVLVGPVGEEDQALIRVEVLGGVRFVPMVHG